MNVPYRPPTSKRHQPPDQREDIKPGTGTYLVAGRYAQPEEGNDTGGRYHDAPQRTKRWAMGRREDEGDVATEGEHL